MFNYDDRLKDAGAVTSSGYGTISAVAKVVTLGAGLIRANMVIDISAVKISAKDETYTFHLMGGSDASFSSEVSLASKEVGKGSALEGNVDAKLSRLTLPFMNEERGIVYPYVRVRHVISGTSPSINYKARLEAAGPKRGVTSDTQTQTTTTTTTTV
jgi:hypothetical protein